MNRRLSIVCAALGAQSVCFSFAHAGSLAPPGGAITPTMRTLDEVEPRTPVQSLPGDLGTMHIISAPGSYYLTGDIQGSIFRCGIRVTTSNVTIDLNGFELRGGNAAADGICIDGAQRNVRIFNGTIADWGDETSLATASGIFGPDASDCTVENVIVSGCLDWGFRLGRSCILSQCVASGNGTIGIETGEGCVLSKCSSFANGQSGIQTAAGCALVDCSSAANTSDGYQLGAASALASSVASDNGDEGVEASPACAIVDSTAQANTGIGILTGDGCAIFGSTTRDNLHGIAAGGPPVIGANGGCAIVQCTATENVDGIVAGEGSVIYQSSGISNSSDGFDAGPFSTISLCRAAGNTGRGFVTGENGVITSSTARFNLGAAGFLCTGNVSFPGRSSLWADCVAATHLNGRGFEGIQGSFLVGCQAIENSGGGYGISVGNGSFLLRNVAQRNSLGITTGAVSRVQENSALNNFGVGLNGLTFMTKNVSIGNTTVDYQGTTANLFGPVTNNPATLEAWANLSTP